MVFRLRVPCSMRLRAISVPGGKRFGPLPFPRSGLGGGNYVAASIQHFDVHHRTAIQAVSSAGNSRVIGADGHLHFVERPLVDLAALNHLQRSLFDAHVHGCDVVRGTHDQVGAGDAPVVVGGVVVD
jgi:hypothetical protein